ncbi:MAG: Calx-beta domain-containing protein [Acidimicrobiales bacterium]
MVLAAAVVSGALFGVGTPPAHADVTSVSGLAFGYYVKAGLFGGPQSVRGYGQTIPPGDAGSESPSVSLPPTGGDLTQTDPDGAAGIYGPAHIFENHGPLIVSTQGSTGPSGSVTSSAEAKDIQPYDPFTAPAPGGVKSTCTANETGLTGSTTITNGRLLLVDPDPDVWGEPGEIIITPPTNPVPGLDYAGIIGTVNDYFTIVFNEQIFTPDAITVNAVHVYMEGPIAVGDFVIASSHCGVTATSSSQPPAANDDAFSTGVDQALSIPSASLLSNDSDPELSPLKATKVAPTPPPETGTPCDPYPTRCAVWPTPSDPSNGTVQVTTNGSFLYTPNPGFQGTDSFTYQATDKRGQSDTATVTVTVTPNTYLAVNNVWVTEGNAGTTNATFTITRSGKTNLSSTVTYATTNGTATAGSDYAAIAATPVTFASGETTKTVAVSVTGDTAAEGHETFNLVLSGLVGATLSDGTGIATIRNDDGAAYLSVDNVWVTEGNAGTATATFTITRSGNTGDSSSVTYATSDGTAAAGSDYTAVAATPVTFAAGETTKTVDVSVSGDVLVEGHETFNLVLSGATGATIVDTTGVATIQNDDGATYLAISDVVVTEGNAGTTPATFTITRSGNTNGTSSVNYSTVNGTATAGSDYTAVGATPVSFAAGETSKTVNVSVTGDTTDEANETFSVNLSGASGAVVSDPTGAATIIDDEGAVTAGPSTFFSINDIMLTEGSGGTTAATFTVTRSGDTSGTGSVRYLTTNGTASAPADYTALTTTVLSFAAGETSKPVTVTVAADTVTEGDETFNLNLFGPVGGVLSDTAGVATVLNDEFSSFSVNDFQVAEQNGDINTTFTVTRTGNVAGAASVKYNTGNGTAVAPDDYLSLGLTQLNFAVGETSKTVTVRVKGDKVTEGDENFTLNLSAAVGGAIADALGVATILNDDFAQLSIADRTIVEGNAGTTEAHFVVTRAGATGGPASFTYATVNGSAIAGSDYSAIGATVVTLDPGETVKLVTVLVLGDVNVEPAETFNVSLSGAVSAVITDSTGVGTITNDD